MALLKNNLPKDLPIDRPKSLGEAKRLIDETFRLNRWNAADRRRYLDSLGITGEVSELKKDETHKVIADFEKYQMVIFNE